ncbi:3-hexulose-6-phosphate synthase [Sulfodiicoccus acidiphilus]|uniref:3-hexulose-6-phosphate synthase n=1 Tax=Sulfodiicoccus acidiphilus TaxID=1670455 RepID=A0A348B2V1_9CREN|nr:orotidine 5'-phosphate decarboxylase / HUMPS family protein [Sulfodiicoccus acidiphilus]BBD72503.1 3-hexulose-6-phosphate synthase [Sulfodiicoccus acidiphilus]GGT94073.1 3-hexulose-6-phosphate synthase [Sulfodiicoccus acidiphilus]
MDVKERLSSRRNLQVALDFLKLEDALKVAEASISGGVHLLEVGTPLLKAEGVRAVREIKKLAGERPVVADTKTADAGEVEVEIARMGQANVMTVLAAMDDSTIQGAVRKAKQIGILVQADLINVPDPVARARRLKELEVDIVGIHVGIDVQKSRKVDASVMSSEIRKIGEMGLLVSVAGGLNRSSVQQLLDLPINIYVVGSAITRARDPETATREIVNVISGRI